MKYFIKEIGKGYADKASLHAGIRKNLDKIIAEKKATIKLADAYGGATVTGGGPNVIESLKAFAIKAGNPMTDIQAMLKEINLPNLIVTAVANTTNWFDSHWDVHIDGNYKKTVKDNNKKGFLHLQEHKAGFAAIIDDEAKVHVENTTFKELGFPYEGSTQALMGVSNVDPNRNFFMYNQYANGWVKNHSIGLRYVNIVYCVNSEFDGDKEYKKNWDKYYPDIANKEDVDQYGCFFAVLEIKLCEYSAVVQGSNRTTPTIDTQAVETPQKEAVEAPEHPEAPETEPKADPANDPPGDTTSPASDAWKEFFNRNN